MISNNHATIRVSADRLRRTLNSLEASGKITAEHKQQIRWQYVHARDNHWTYDQLAAVLEVTPSAALRIFDGHLDGDYADCVARIAAYHARVNAEKKNLYIETPTFKKIDDFCFAVRSMKTPGFITSASQTGKTEGMMEVKRRDTTGSTLLIRCPAAPSLLAVYAEIARAMHIPYRSKDVINLRYHILEALDDYDLVLFDELHQAFIGARRQTTIKIIESLRAIFDYKAMEDRKIGMIFCGTDVLDDKMGEDGSMYLILDQFRRRGILRLTLPPIPPMEDAHAISKSFGLPHPAGDALNLVKYMLRDSGIGQYIHYMRSGKVLADSESRPMTWEDYLAAYDIIDQMGYHDPEKFLTTSKKRR